MSGEELDKLMWHWPAVINAAADEWSRGFALNINKLASSPRWRPSPKQAQLMRQAVSDLFSSVVIIEREVP